MNKIRFGPAGNSDSFYAQGNTSTVQMPKWISNMGLSAFEYSFGRGVRLSAERAVEISEEAVKYDIQLSVHMPYYINLAVLEAEKKEKNVSYFIDSLTAANAMGAKRAVFHPGAVTGGVSRTDALKNACALLAEIIAVVEERGLSHITMCAETMGKINQLGSLEEVIALCNVDERIFPAIDFGHLHCRGLGAINSEQDYIDILDALENGVGLERTRNMHVHFSRIEYTKGGEKKHHTFADTQYGPDFEPLAMQIAKREYTPVLICESKGTMAEDSQKMLVMYENARNSLLKDRSV